jgi:hypothetical protein
MRSFVLAWWPWSSSNRHPGLEFIRMLGFVVFMFLLILALVSMWLVLWFELFIPSAATQKSYYSGSSSGSGNSNSNGNSNGNNNNRPPVLHENNETTQAAAAAAAAVRAPPPKQ